MIKILKAIKINNKARMGIMVLGVMMVGIWNVRTASAAPTLSLSSSGAQTVNVGAADNNIAINADTISVTTSCKYGYNLLLSTSVNDNNLYFNGNVANNTTGTFFSPADGTTALNASTNTWGYFYDGTNTPTESSVFSAVPALGSTAVTIKSPLTTPSSTDIKDSLKVYYGVSAATGMKSGAYKMIPDTNNDNKDGTIVYQATIAEDCIKYKVEFNPTGTNMGTAITGTGTMNPQSIYEGVATPLSTNGFTAPSGYYFMGWNTAQDGSGTSYTNGQSVTDLTTAGNTITLYAQWTDCPGGNICYSSNVANATDVAGSMGNQTVSNTATSATLYASNFKRDGYGFAGWNTKADGTGTNYGPNQTITITAGQYSAGGLRLYAKWIKSAGDLQGWTCPDNTTMPIGEITALKDTRDNNVYAIAKLADGKCWMIENLRLADKDASNNDIELSNANTHNPSLPLTNSWWYSSTNDSDTKPTSNKLSASVNPTTTAWCTTYSSNCINQSMLATNNTTLFTNNTSTSYSASSNVYSYGNYYNWYSATAGHGTYSKSSGNTAGDICPANWHLPTGKDATGDFGVLDIAMGGTGAYQSGDAGKAQSAKWRSYPNNFVYSGYVGGSSVGSRSSYGGYWSSSALDSGSAYNLDFSSRYVYPGASNYYKYNGFMARCVSGV